MNTDIQSHNFNRHGFTLVEVLVSSFLTLVIMAMLFGVLMGTISAWEGGTSSLKSSGDARFAMDLIKTDLESMVARQTSFNQEWMVSEPVVIESLPNFSKLFFFSPSLDRAPNQQGDIVAINYQVLYQDPIFSGAADKQFPIFGLYKTIATKNGLPETETAFNLALGQTDVLAGFWDGVNPDKRGFIAPNVVKFEISWWIRSSADNKVYRFGPENTIRLGNQLFAENTAAGWEGTGGKIESAEVSMTTISDEGMRRYNFLDNPNLDLIIQEFGQTHTMRIPIHY